MLTEHNAVWLKATIESYHFTKDKAIEHMAAAKKHYERLFTGQTIIKKTDIFKMMPLDNNIFELLPFFSTHNAEVKLHREISACLRCRSIFSFCCVFDKSYTAEGFKHTAWAHPENQVLEMYLHLYDEFPRLWLELLHMIIVTYFSLSCRCMLSIRIHCKGTSNLPMPFSPLILFIPLAKALTLFIKCEESLLGY